MPEDAAVGRDYVVSEIARAQADGRTLFVYVGAKWCEPCKRFHAAVERGELDRELANVRFLEFDLDVHQPLLDEGDMNCRSRLIPVFSRVNDDGTCSDRRIEGGIKGDGAVRHIMPRLKPLL